MAWSSWKPQDRRRPPGQWRQFQLATRVVGINLRPSQVMSFVEGVSAAEKHGDNWSVMLQREPTNSHHSNAVMVFGCWTQRRKRWFRSELVEQRREHIGYIERDLADQIADFGAHIPIAAELYEIATNDDRSGEYRDVLGVIIKIIILIPSKKDPIWSSTPQ